MSFGGGARCGVCSRALIFRFQTFHADPARTHLIHAESYTGIMAWFMGYSMASTTTAQLQESNEDLKVAAEKAYSGGARQKPYGA